jgi:ubiquinone/menaquinone biosynthesis C-methylase UbiE
MDHDEIVCSEFARQAATFSRAAKLAAAEITEAVAVALGSQRGGRVLDLACGPGILTEALLGTGALPVGLDLTADTLRLAGTRVGAGAVFAQGLAERLPFGPDTFTGAAIRLALHHVKQPVQVLRAVRDVLVVGGRLVVVDALTSPDPATAALHNAIERLRDPSHTAFVSQGTLEAQLREAGFVLESAEYWERAREFSEWAAIINEPVRMDSLKTVLRALVVRGETAGIDLREQAGELWFTYRWGRIVATATAPHTSVPEG